MFGDYNNKKEINEAMIAELIKNGYNDLGWANSGAKFTHHPDDRDQRDVDCGLYSCRGTNTVFIDDKNREILHVDMSD